MFAFFAYCLFSSAFAACKLGDDGRWVLILQEKKKKKKETIISCYQIEPLGGTTFFFQNIKAMAMKPIKYAKNICFGVQNVGRCHVSVMSNDDTVKCPLSCRL